MRVYHLLSELLVLALSVAGCENPERKAPSAPPAPSPAGGPAQALVKQVPSGQRRDTLVIEARSAVFYSPDSLQMDRRMKQAGEENFRQGADDYLYYLNTSAEYLEKEGIPVLDAQPSRYLKFILSGADSQIIHLDTLPDLWGLYLFEPGKRPHYADITEIEKEYDSYFAKKPALILPQQSSVFEKQVQ